MSLIKNAVTRIGVIACTCAAFTVLATTAWAHAALDHATPAVGSSGPSPGQITLTFTEKIEPAFSKAEVRNASGGRVGGQSRATAYTLRVDVGNLPPGTYTVKWQVLSVDTHKTQGNFPFTVRP